MRRRLPGRPTSLADWLFAAMLTVVVIVPWAILIWGVATGVWER